MSGTRRDQDRRAGAPAANGFEDSRFIRGKGQLHRRHHACPACLHMEILRSRWRNGGGSPRSTPARRGKFPGVHLVLTGEMMATRKPGLDADACPTTPRPWLATDQGAVSRARRWLASSPTTPYIAKDACEAIEVDYEPLPPIVKPGPGGSPRARPVIRDDKEGPAGTTSSTTGRSAATRAGHRPGVRAGRRDLQAEAATTRARTRRRSSAGGSIADFNRGPRPKLTVYMTTQAAAHHPGRGSRWWPSCPST